LNKIFSIIVAVLYAVRIYSNSVHCLPNFQLNTTIATTRSTSLPYCWCQEM